MILEGLVGAGIMFFGMTAGWVMNNVAHKTNNASKTSNVIKFDDIKLYNKKKN